MPARLPHLWVHDERAIHPHHPDLLPVRTQGRVAHHVVPPDVLYVLLQLDPQRPVIPEAVDAAVDLARLEDEPATTAQGNELLHVHDALLLASPIESTGCDRW